MVSVIIPTYNRAHLIKRSALSVLNQTYSNLELIIVDDGSTDNTEKIVKSINDDRVIYIKQPNQGACAARNNGINHAKGEFIAFHDSDDVWHQDKLEKQLETLRRTKADLVVCGCVGISPIRRTKVFLKYSNSFLDNEKWPFAIGTQTFFGKCNVFKNIKFDIEILRWQDFEILTRIQEKYKIYCSEDLLVDYYMQDDSISKGYKNLLKTLEYVFYSNRHSIKLTRKYNNDLAENIVYNLQDCPNIPEKKQLLKMAYSISDNSYYIRYKLFVIRIFSSFKSFIKRRLRLFVINKRNSNE